MRKLLLRLAFGLILLAGVTWLIARDPPPCREANIALFPCFGATSAGGAR